MTVELTVELTVTDVKRQPQVRSSSSDARERAQKTTTSEKQLFRRERACTKIKHKVGSSSLEPLRDTRASRNKP